MVVKADQLKQVMRNWTTGVAIVSSCFNGDTHGMTVNSFTSISIDPAMVVVTLANNTHTCQMVKKSLVFGVTILSSQQKSVSDRFAGKVSDVENRFSGLNTFFLNSDVPFLSDGLAWLDCKVITEYNLEHSTLFIADVIAVRENGGEPLLYHDRDYYRLGEKNG